MSELALKISNVSKQYQLGNINSGTLGRDLNKWWARFRGKEDPYATVGQINDRSKKAEGDFVWSLRDIDFEINRGEAVGIIGKNGAGKSTLLKILSRVTTPTTGEIKIGGRVASLLEVGTGFHPELTGRENIYMNGAILGMTRHEIRTKMDEIVAFSGVEMYIDTPVKRYSSGMYVRLAFAVAAHLESEILIIDEVLAVGDAEFQKKCLGKMGEVSSKDGRTVLFVSHQMGTIAQLCTKSILLQKGHVGAIGPTNNVISQYLKADFDLSNSKNKFQIDEKDILNRSVYFKEVTLLNDKGESVFDFRFNEKIIIDLKLEANTSLGLSDIKIAVALCNKFQNRVFTLVEGLSNFNMSNNIQIELPSDIIAPNSYSFTLALFVHNGLTHHYLENICNFKIHDTGSALSIFEGLDYGNIVINGIWLNN